MSGEEHDGFPDNSAYQPAMPCEMHTLGLDGPFLAPSALGRCQGHAPLGRRSTLGSTLRPHPSARSWGAGPPRPCGLSYRSPQYHPYHSPRHMPLHLPVSLAQPPIGPVPLPWPLPLPLHHHRHGGRERGRESGRAAANPCPVTIRLRGRCTNSPPGRSSYHATMTTAAMTTVACQLPPLRCRYSNCWFATNCGQ